MGKYLDWKDYFEDLATKNIAIAHDATVENNKKFFEVMLEEIISGITHQLPSKEKGAFIIFTGYLDRLLFKHQTNKNRELMFFVMQSTGLKDYSSQSIAKSNCESIVQDFLTKMLKDSKEEHPIFDQAFNRIENVSIIPNEFKIGTSTYVGWQVSINLTIPFNSCYITENWLP